MGGFSRGQRVVLCILFVVGLLWMTTSDIAGFPGPSTSDPANNEPRLLDHSDGPHTPRGTVVSTPRRPLMVIHPFSDDDFSEEEDPFVALPVSSPLSNLFTTNDTNSPLLMANRYAIVERLTASLALARDNPQTYFYQKVATRAKNESLYPWEVVTEVFTSVSHRQCVAVVTATRPRLDQFDRYRPMVNEHADWQDVMAYTLGPDAFRVVGRSLRSVEVGTSILASQLEDDSAPVVYVNVLKLSDEGVYNITLDHVHRAYGAFTDTDRRGAYCPMPPPSRKRTQQLKYVEYDNRVREHEGRTVAVHTVECRGLNPSLAPTVESLPLCKPTSSPEDLLDGRYLAKPPEEQAPSASATAVSERNFTIKGEPFRWFPRTCRIRHFSSEAHTGDLMRLFQSQKLRVLFLGDSQMRTMVNAFFSVLFNRPPEENNRGEYRKVASIVPPSVAGNSNSNPSSTAEFLWDPQGQIITNFDIIIKRDVRRFENILKKFLKKKVKGKTRSTLDLPQHHHPKKKSGRHGFGTVLVDRPPTDFSPEGVSWLRSWWFWKEGRPTAIVLGFGGWNMWLCESFEEAEWRLHRTVDAVRQLVALGTTVVFVGWPAPVDSLQVTQAKRRMTSSRIGLLMDLTRVELAAAGATVLPLFEMAFPFPELSSKHSASHYDNTTVLYGMSDFVATMMVE